ncbi:hypothetical protein LSAT2_009042, partial [Lamellibrachia satsuma]
EKNYFTKGTNLKASDIIVHHRDCTGCKSSAVSCTDGSLKVYLEYIAMDFFQDTEVTTVRNRWQKNCLQRTGCHQSNTNQEFILGEYLVGNYPDVILLFSSNHDKGRYRLQTVRAYIDYLKMIINMYVPKRTQVFWFSKISETLMKKPKIWRNVTFDGKSTTNEQIERLNRELFDVLRPELIRKDGKISTFFDMYDMSLGVPQWSVDGVHRKSECGIRKAEERDTDRGRRRKGASEKKDIDCYVGEKGHRLLRRRERTSTATSERKDIDCYVFTSSCLHLRHLEKRLSLQERNLYSQEMLLCGTLIAIDKLHFEIDGCQ